MRTAMPMCSSAYWRRTSCAGAGRAHSVATVRARETTPSVRMATKLTLALRCAAWARSAAGQAAARLVPFRDSIAPTLVTFEMIPVPGGTVTLDSPTGPRVVVVAPFWIGKTEVTWDEYDVWVYRLDLAAAAPGGSESADAAARPSRPHGAPDRGFGHRGYPDLSMPSASPRAASAQVTAKP